MAYISQRLHEVEGWGGESESLPPTENVLFQIDDVKQEASSQKGTPMLIIETKVLEPPSIAGRKLRAQYVNAPDAKEGSRRRLRALIDGTGIQLDNQGGFNDEDLIGRVFVADVINEPYVKTDAVTGAKVEKMSARIQNERFYDQGQEGQPQFQAQAGQGEYPGGQQPQGYGGPGQGQGGYVPQNPAPAYGGQPQPGYGQQMPQQQSVQHQQQPMQPAAGVYTGGGPGQIPHNGAPGPASARVTRPGPVHRV